MSDRLSIPAAIIVAGLLIAGAIYASNASKGTEIKDPDVVKQIASIVNNPAEVGQREVGTDDFVRGSANAPITFIEYSDLECPFCKRFHETLLLVMKDHPGKIRWVYRHYPLDALHSKARNEALASECVAAQLGNDGFWKFIDSVFETTQSNDSLDPAKLPELAVQAGADKAKFEACMKDGTLLSKVQEDAADGDIIGIQGTPFTLVIGPDGKKYGIPGAFSYSTVSGVVDELLHRK
jgi:protein-disulfide isomerase